MRFKTIFVMANILAPSNTKPLYCTAVLPLLLPSTFCPETNCLYLGPELTNLFFAVRVGVKPQGPFVPLCRDLPPDVSEVAAVPLSCLGAPPRRTCLEW
jgi:hypothetical protein